MPCSLRGTCVCLTFVAVNRICFSFIILLLQLFVETRFRRDWRSPNGVLVFIHMGKSRHSSPNICGKPSVVPRPNSFIGCQSCQSGGFSLNSILVLLIRSQNPFLIRTTNVNHNVGAESVSSPVVKKLILMSVLSIVTSAYAWIFVAALTLIRPSLLLLYCKERFRLNWTVQFNYSLNRIFFLPTGVSFISE